MDDHHSVNCVLATGRPTDLAQAYFNTLRETLDIHAPAKTVTLRSPWYNDDVDEARHKRHQMEHIWRRTKLEIHHQLYSDFFMTKVRKIRTELD